MQQIITSFPFVYDTNLWFSEIDKAVQMKVNWILLSMRRGKAEYDKIRAGTAIDPAIAAAAYARSKGLKVSLISVISWWGTYKTNPKTIDDFLADLELALNNCHPDGFEAEEFPTKGATTAQLNDVWNRIRQLITKMIGEGKLPPDFQLGASFASHLFSTFKDSGIDIQYLNDSKVLDYVRPEMIFQTVSAVENGYNLWKEQFPNVSIRPTLYVTWTALKKACIANGYSGFNDPTCLNQGWFKEIDWAFQKGIGMAIYYVNTYPIKYWLNNPYPGRTVPEIIGGILSKSQSPTIGTLDIRSIPTGAAIKINGGNYGVTNRTRDFEPGTYNIELTLAGFLPLADPNVIITAGSTTLIEYTLIPVISTGSLDIRSIPDEAVVYVDGESKGVTNKLIEGLTPGVHTIKLTKDGYDDVDGTVLIQVGIIDTQEYTLVPSHGILSISSLPVDGAKIFMDNIDTLAVTPATLFVSLGTHSIKIVKPGFKDFIEINIPVSADQIITKIYTLMQESKDAAGTVITITTGIVASAALFGIGSLLKR